MFKEKNRRQIQICVLILFLLMSFIFRFDKPSNYNKLSKNHPENLKSSYYIVSPIYIDGDNPSSDWAYFKSHYPWCSGSGTIINPYIIDNIFIDASGVGSCIRILDTEDYFIIQNCLLNNSVYGFDIDYTDNGRIQNNTISYHSQYGIEAIFSHNITIDNNIFTNNYRGIHVYLSSRNINITNNNVSNCVDYGIYLGGVYNSTISNNVISNNGNEGIDLYDCGGNTLTDNILENNGNEGIILEGFPDESIDNIFFNNTASFNGVGMSIGGTNNLVMNNSLFGNTEGLIIYGGDQYIAYNNVSLNINNGIQILGYNSEFYMNTVNENTDGIYVTGWGNNITGNIVNFNSQSGITVHYADNNHISYNSFSYNTNYGMYLEGEDSGNVCDNNEIIENEIIENAYGIYLWWYCENNEIYGNNISDNTNTGILFWEYCDWNIISSNQIYDNFARGLWFMQRSENNIIFNNTIFNNDIGVRMQATNYYNNFSSNTIENNNAGISIEQSTTSYNNFYNNYFINNLIHVNDAGFLNYWNSSTIGNYWDDMTYNIDINDDGIGEIPYNISLSPLIQDFLPIFKDWDDPAPPTISITLPQEYQITGIDSPNFKISTYGLYVHTIWYELVGGSKNITVTENIGKIDQELWEEIGNGTATLRFYVNDSLGYGTSDETVFRKDINNPSLTINSPINDTLFDSTSPTFNVELSDANLDFSWYSLDGGLTKTFFTTNSSINQTIWDSKPDGQVEIIFYVNDTAENLVFDSVIVNKDTHPPLITITSPIPSELFGNSTINFNVEIYDLNLEEMWYTIVGSPTNFSFISNGTIDPTLWDSFGSGSLTLIFYANDTHGRISSESVIISKDIDPPNLNIISPIAGESFYVTAPGYEITVDDPHLILVWYTIDGGITNINITDYTGFIDSSIWTSAPIGDITIRFYAKDTLGNTAFKEVIISKESVQEPQPEPMIPGYNLFILIGILGIVVSAIVKRYRPYH